MHGGREAQRPGAGGRSRGIEDAANMPCGVESGGQCRLQDTPLHSVSRYMPGRAEKIRDVVRGQVRDFRLHCPGGHDRGAGPSRRGDGRVLPFARAGGTAHGGSLPACRQRGRHPAP